ncbi:alpha-ketoglutarate-dependent dioxygenase alkB homolog 3 isoform X2 [Takifugu flavidus]|uniref:alpha-ketoglutarate-dependent dioxygenase alkB homolog 3 isoform X2 n=1 Tax=Takifugu flavidus TaxID=433684 RepID=UPI00254429B0|nr:alpha-ketoglutarate-dependent dioxygenase alkB homolog 3 isoform X2 [Takifugu flavidus]XP_056907295.1 alpha-ketoglutarate-dependent dioxygenase alkB homolog 3 isoform X2 [Takifugu flavidus]
MTDKRQQARVQGCWARRAGPRGPGLNQQPFPTANTASASASWGIRSQETPKTFEFQPPAKLVQAVPPVKLLEKEGDYELSHGPSGVSRLLLVPGFLPPEEADWIYSKLLAELPWSQKTNYRHVMYLMMPVIQGDQVTSQEMLSHEQLKDVSIVAAAGEAYEEPRLTCWYGALPYTYARSSLTSNTQWHPLLLKLREAVERRSGCSFNSLLCNLYRDGRDSIGWHSDDEASLGHKPTIASLSLGDTRVFSLRKIPPPEDEGDYTYVDRIQVPLSHGSLLLMSGSTQDDWQHRVAKEYHERGPRVNLTFRTIHEEPEGHRAGTKLRFTVQHPREASESGRSQNLNQHHVLPSNHLR